MSTKPKPIVAMTPRQRRERAKIAEKVIIAFVTERTGEYCGSKGDDCHGDLGCGLRDLISDFMHLCDAKGWDFAELEAMARDNYLAELV